MFPFLKKKKPRYYQPPMKHFLSSVLQKTGDAILCGLKTQHFKDQNCVISGGVEKPAIIPFKDISNSLPGGKYGQPAAQRTPGTLSLDVSNMALPTEEKRCLPSDRENMEAGSLAASHQTGGCPCKQNSQGQAQLLLEGKSSKYSSDSIHTAQQESCPHEPICS